MSSPRTARGCLNRLRPTRPHCPYLSALIQAAVALLDHDA
ncbi:hypothetical protein HMPREF9057_01666 [Actinomyces sp. oral taxon 171 str. F0337]|nr:hypothetical protein HMPREF9057_01666 [Actinomyces sp. oral taxon 171 str. F0337]